jgi:PAS domain S-box-containing protein
VQERLGEARGLTGDHYRLLVDAVRDYAIIMLDADGHVVTWNAGAERMTGYRPSEAVGAHVRSFYTPEDATANKPERELSVAAESGRFETEGWRLRKDGTRFWASVVVGAVRDDTGRLCGFGEITRDLTDILRAEEVEREVLRQSVARTVAEIEGEKLRASEEAHRRTAEQLKVILSNVAEGITVEGRGGRLVFANDAAARIVALESGDALMSARRDRVREAFVLLTEGGDVIDGVRPWVHDAFDGLTGRATTKIVNRATGQHRWADVSATPVYGADGAPELVVCVWHDVTEERSRARAARFLSRAATVLAGSIENGPPLGALSDLLVPEFADWCAIDVLEERGMRSFAVSHRDPSKLDAARAAMQRQAREWERIDASPLRTGRARLFAELSNARAAGWTDDPEHARAMAELGLCSAIVVPIRTAEHVSGLLTLAAAAPTRRFDERDLALAVEIGARAAIAIENARLYADAQEALRVRNDFLSVAGHELKTPLVALTLQLQSLEQAFARGTVAGAMDRWAERVKRALGQSARLERVIGQLLDVSRITSGRLAIDREPLDLALLAREVGERFADELARAGSKVTFTQSGATSGRWDRARIDQVVTNLLGNAVKYGAGKPIDVSVAGGAEGASERVQMVVRDHGIGIPAEAQARIFGRFERAVSDRNYGGFGLSLWIARQVVEAHGGTIRFESAPGAGSTFTVELPTG